MSYQLLSSVDFVDLLSIFSWNLKEKFKIQKKCKYALPKCDADLSCFNNDTDTKVRQDNGCDINPELLRTSCLEKSKSLQVTASVIYYGVE